MWSGSENSISLWQHESKEKLWLEKFKSNTYTDDQLIEVMVANPILIERPIAVNGNKAVIARPLDKIKTII